jgi:hypothetical protein
MTASGRANASIEGPTPFRLVVEWNRIVFVAYELVLTVPGCVCAQPEVVVCLIVEPPFGKGPISIAEGIFGNRNLPCTDSANSAAIGSVSRNIPSVRIDTARFRLNLDIFRAGKTRFVGDL